MMIKPAMFLTPEEVACLTSMHGGCKGKTRSERQIGQLRKMKIPHYVNAAGRPVVVRAIIEGGKATPVAAHDTWEPRLA